MSLPTYEDALAVVLAHQKASPSLIQRKLQIGYNRAMDFIERMEAEGVCARPNSAGLRVLLATIGNTPQAAKTGRDPSSTPDAELGPGRNQ